MMVEQVHIKTKQNEDGNKITPETGSNFGGGYKLD